MLLQRRDGAGRPTVLSSPVELPLPRRVHHPRGVRLPPRLLEGPHGLLLRRQHHHLLRVPSAREECAFSLSASRLAVLPRGGKRDHRAGADAHDGDVGAAATHPAAAGRSHVVPRAALAVVLAEGAEHGAAVQGGGHEEHHRFRRAVDRVAGGVGARAPQ